LQSCSGLAYFAGSRFTHVFAQFLCFYVNRSYNDLGFTVFAGLTDAWRKHPICNLESNFKNMFPGLGTAVALFAVYVVFDQGMSAMAPKKEKHHH